MPYIYLLITIFLFSTMEIAGRMIHNSIPPMLMTFLRFFLGSLIIIPFAIINKRTRDSLKKLKLQTFIYMSLIGILNVFISMGLLQIAVHNGNAYIPAILISSNPLFVFLIMTIVNKKFEYISFFKILCGIIGIMGIILLTPNTHLDNAPVSFILSIIASIAFAVYTILARKFVIKYGNLLTTSVSFIMGSLMYLPFIFIFEKNILTNLEFTMTNIIIIMYMGFFVTGIAYLSYFQALKYLTAQKGSLVFFLKPAIATILAFIFLNEQITLIQIVFLIFIMIAVYPYKIKEKL